MNVLGIDGGLAHMGLATLGYDGPDYTLTVKDGQVVETKPSAKKLGVRKGDDNMRRAREVAGALLAMVERWCPSVIVYEAQSFGMRGSVAARQAGTAFGIIAGIAEARFIPLVCVQPAEVKKAVCPDMKGVSKLDVVDAVGVLFPGQIPWPKDEKLWEHLGDAIGVVWAARRDELLVAMAKASRAKVA